jgi:hypothetical protein
MRTPLSTVHFEKAPPIVVRSLFKRFGLEDPEIIHQDIDRGKPLDYGART